MARARELFRSEFSFLGCGRTHGMRLSGRGGWWQIVGCNALFAVSFQWCRICGDRLLWNLCNPSAEGVGKVSLG